MFSLSKEKGIKRVEVSKQGYFNKHWPRQYTCGNCHNKIYTGFIYCPTCGYKVLKEKKNDPIKN